MKRIVVATDFSPGSDCAIRRAAMLAQTFGAGISLVHAIDDDRPASLVEAAQAAALPLLDAQVRHLRDVDGVDGDGRIVFGGSSSGIVGALDETDADLLVVGSHRRAALKDMFVGTTAERAIRTTHKPVLMVNMEPKMPYGYVLTAVDLSDCSARAFRIASEHSHAGGVPMAVLHVYEVPPSSVMASAALAGDEIEDRRADHKLRAAGELDDFMAKLDGAAVRKILRPHETAVGDTILAVARELPADLVVVGTHGRSGMAKLLLGSVAEEVLRHAECDVLAVPPARSD